MQKCLWLGEVSETRENSVKGNTYNPSFATLLDTQLQSSEKRRTTRDAGQQTNVMGDIVAEPATKQQRTTSPHMTSLDPDVRPPPDSPTATSPTGRQHPPLPAPPHRHYDSGRSHATNQKTPKDTTIKSTDEATTKEPQPLRQSIIAVTLSAEHPSLSTQTRRPTHNLRQLRL